jgi:ABC-type tungstate transport system permease subunit
LFNPQPQSRIRVFTTTYCRYSKAESDINVRIVAVGTGQALRNAKKCDAELVIVHSKIDEEEFVIDGFGSQRHDLMYNDFILVGPKDDPAKIGTAKTTVRGFSENCCGQSQIRITK